MTGRRKLLLSIACLVAINCFISWVLWQAAVLELEQIRRQLGRWTVLSQSLGWVVLLAAAAASYAPIRSEWHGISRKYRLALLGLVLGSLLLVWFLPPRTNRIYFDEHIYENIAQSIAAHGDAFLCNEGEAEYKSYRPFGTEYNKQPNGHPFYQSIFFRLFGISEWSAHLANNLALTLGVVFIFFAALLLFQSETAAFFAGLLYMLTPMNLIWSATAAVEPSAAAFSALAIAASALYARRPAPATAAVWASAVGLSVYFRPESICLLVPALLIVLTFRWQELLEVRFYGAALLLSLLVGIELLHLYAVRNEGWGTTGERFSWDSFHSNLLVNGPYLYLNQRLPVFFSLLALVGMLALRHWRALTPVFVWLIYSFGVFLFFYAGSFDYGADVRFSMISSAPLAVLGGLGAAIVVSWLSRAAFLALPAVPLVFSVILLAWIPFMPLIRAVGTEAADARVDIDAIRAFAAELPDESMVLSHTPAVWLLLGRNSAQSSTATYNPGHIENDYFRRYTGGVYFHWGAWCNYDNPVQQGFCTRILERFTVTIIDQRFFGQKPFTLYRLALRTDAERKNSGNGAAVQELPGQPGAAPAAAALPQTEPTPFPPPATSGAVVNQDSPPQNRPRPHRK